MEKTNTQLALREIRIRSRIGVLSVLCFLGSTVLALAIAWLWVSVSRAWAFAILGIWLGLSLPFFAFMLVMLGDVVVLLATGYTFSVHTILRWGELENARRKLAKRPPMAADMGSLERLVWDAVFYSNPLSPVVVLLGIYLLSKPPLDAVKEAAERFRQSPPARIVGDVGWGVGQHIGGRHVAA